MPFLTIGYALIIGGTIVLVSTLTAAGIAQRWPRRVLQRHDDEEHLRYEFADAVPTADSEEAMRHPPPRLSLEHLTALPDRNRA